MGKGKVWKLHNQGSHTQLYTTMFSMVWFFTVCLGKGVGFVVCHCLGPGPFLFFRSHNTIMGKAGFGREAGLGHGTQSANNMPHTHTGDGSGTGSVTGRVVKEVRREERVREGESDPPSPSRSVPSCQRGKGNKMKEMDERRRWG